MDEALKRAEAYRRAGADAILIHSKLSKPDEIVTFAREWAGRSPLVIVPTRYYSTPTDVFRLAGISMVIWANHMVRSATSAMQSVAKEIFESQTLVNIEDRIVLYLHTESVALKQAIQTHKAYIMSETLATEWATQPLGDKAYRAHVKVDGQALAIELRKAKDASE